MSQEDLKRLLEEMERLNKEHLASPEKARAFLVEAGIIDEQGALTEHYR